MMRSLFSVALLGFLSCEAYAQTSLRALGARASSRGGGGSVQAGADSPRVAPLADVQPTSTDWSNCPSDGVSRISLNQLSYLLSGSGLSLDHDPDEATLRISGNMVSNCNSMLDWNRVLPTEPSRDYAVSLDVVTCGATTCPYTVIKKENGQQREVTINVAPTYEGFVQCLRETGVLTDAGLAQAAVIERPFEETLTGFNTTGDVQFRSHIAHISEDEPSPFGHIVTNRCDYLENVQRGGLRVFSAADVQSNRNRIAVQNACASGSLSSFGDSLARFSDQESEFGHIFDAMILSEVEALATAVRANENVESLDYSILEFFRSRIIDPLTNKITSLYEQIENMPNSQRRRDLIAELVREQAKLALYRNAPYFNDVVLDNMMAKGRFDEAEVVRQIQVTANNYSNIRKEHNGRIVTPALAARGVENAMDTFAAELPQKRRVYNVRTGRATGVSAGITSAARGFQQDIEVRNRNFGAAIQQAQQRAMMCQQQGRAVCVRQQAELIQRWTAELQARNAADTRVITQLAAQATYYRGLEEEGARYVAARGEQVQSAPGEVPPTPERQDTEPAGGGEYDFNAQAGGGQQQQFAPQQQQFPWQQQTQGQGQYQFPQAQLYGQQQQFGQQQFPFAQQQFGQQQFPFAQQQFGQQQFPFAQQQYGQQQLAGYSPMFGQQQQGYNPFMQQQGYSPFAQQAGGGMFMQGGFGMQPPMMGMQGGFGQQPMMGGGQYNFR